MKPFRLPPLSEKDERKRVHALADKLGIVHRSFSESRPGWIDAGIPDERHVWPAKRIAWWYEAKCESPRSRLTRLQHEFLVNELACHELAFCGTFSDYESVVRLITGGMTVSAVRRRCEELVSVWAAKGYRPVRELDYRQRRAK